MVRYRSLDVNIILHSRDFLSNHSNWKFAILIICLYIARHLCVGNCLCSDGFDEKRWRFSLEEARVSIVSRGGVCMRSRQLMRSRSPPHYLSIELKASDSAPPSQHYRRRLGDGRYGRKSDVISHQTARFSVGRSRQVIIIRGGSGGEKQTFCSVALKRPSYRVGDLGGVVGLFLVDGWFGVGCCNPLLVLAAASRLRQPMNPIYLPVDGAVVPRDDRVSARKIVTHDQETPEVSFTSPVDCSDGK